MASRRLPLVLLADVGGCGGTDEASRPQAEPPSKVTTGPHQGTGQLAFTSDPDGVFALGERTWLPIGRYL